VPVDPVVPAEVVTRWPLPVPLRSPASVRATVTAVLDQRQFHPEPGLLQRLVNWLHAHLHFPSLHVPSFYAGAWQSYLVLLLVLAAAVTGLVLAMRRGLFRRLGHPVASPGVIVTDEAAALSPEAWRQRAERFAAEGRFREALRCRYCALVGELAQRGFLDEVPGRTSGDYERRVNAVFPEVAQQFVRATALFESCWYGQERSNADEQVLFDRAAELIVQEVDAGRWRAARSEHVPLPAGDAA
jgi:hypothetical protein